MSYDYDALFGTTQNALGQPTQVFVDFFDNLNGRELRVLDIGCGQGRDAVFIARLGHTVVGVDLSKNGICDLNKTARAERLKIKGVVADITNYRPDMMFDIILIDRTLHMLPKEPRLKVLKTLIECVDKDGWVLIADEPSNIADMKRVIKTSDQGFDIHTEKAGLLFAQRAGSL